MWQAIIVGLIVLAAASYAAWVLLPAALRLRLAQRLAAWLRRAAAPQWFIRVADALEAGARRRPGACSDCGAVQASPGTRRDKS
jgi:hypothetical protein